MTDTERHRLDCLVEHYREQIALHMDRLKGTPGTAARRAYVEAVGRSEGPAVAEALRHAFGSWWQANRAAQSYD